MKERLIELLKKADKNTSDKFITDYEDAIADNADYLLDNGVIVLPCAVGDKVYWINPVKKEIETDIVVSINQYENGFSITSDTIGNKCTFTYSLDRFLEIMHFTKEEAEKALNERK